ncbi:Superfamily II DNA or RNA helicase, SNF2 family [Xylanibacter ruminicola]|uniref:Superfamily II DNA or RNA helicase, SNF2 family n=1 Tax=Xylanibacter ruminicola TaxID=839 RepID=A0A1H4C7A9_XYLRU|nr:DEAD/DEAH box helicase [Xylanibacter ruminicola]SEA55982.1 Superfamily II DNA or RNA helicase, SNF2 family [Xylanibacter ruminicola]
MTYRLLCIYETFENDTIPQLRIEVNLDGKSSSLAPFQRKVTLSDLLADASTNGLHPSALCQLINHAGLISQPFCIDSRLVCHPLVQRILQDHPYSYVKATPKSSLKRITNPPSFIHPSSIVSSLASSVPSGILYIENPASWHRNIKVRFRYNDALSDFYPTYSPLPYLTNLGSLMLRDKLAETELLAMLGENYNPATASLSFKNTDTEYLAELTKKGWTLYVSCPNKAASRLYYHHESSGINWFSTDQDINQSEFGHQLLDGYLHRRNYHESDGHIILFKKEDATRSDDKTLVEQLDASYDVRQLYANSQPLTNAEIHAIKSSITNKLHATLRPYQLDGVIWLQQQRKNNHGCLLADEMGLGKTIQIIAHLCCLGKNIHHLIIAPTSLIYNWKNEVSRFAPQLSQQLTFVSYDMLRIHLSDYLPEYYDTIIIDEAQVIKNRQTKKYQAVSQLHCKHKIILTGTPIENSIDELWSHFIMLMPPIQTLYHRLHTLGIQAIPEVYVTLSSKFLKPFILRREKQMVLQELPERIEKTVYVELNETERIKYKQVHTTILQAFATGVSGRISSMALEGLLRLRQACIAPKYQTVIDYIETFRTEGRKVLLFSQFVSALHELESRLTSAGIRFVTLYGDTHNRDIPVRQFQSDPSITVFLISLKAGGFGLNLTSADRVILLDDWWNPAVEDQAMARAHRIGQKNNVLVLRLVCKDTVEEKILQLQDQKRQTVDLFNTTADKLTIEELKLLIS